MVDLAASKRRVEDLPSDSGRVVDTLAGAALRIFCKLSEIEDRLEAIVRRLDSLDHRMDRLETIADEAEFERNRQAIVQPLSRLGDRGRRIVRHNGNDHPASA
jgi:hypothetical protein